MTTYTIRIDDEDHHVDATSREDALTQLNHLFILPRRLIGVGDHFYEFVTETSRCNECDA